MNYENATDEEINEAVAIALISKSPKELSGIVLNELSSIDYCNDWAYGGIVIQSAKISIVFDEHETYVNQGVIESYPWVKHERQVKDGESPLRAAMIVYLMMNEDK